MCNNGLLISVCMRAYYDYHDLPIFIVTAVDFDNVAEDMVKYLSANIVVTLPPVLPFPSPSSRVARCH